MGPQDGMLQAAIGPEYGVAVANRAYGMQLQGPTARTGTDEHLSIFLVRVHLALVRAHDDCCDDVHQEEHTWLLL